MTTCVVKTRITDSVAEVTLDRPPVNALDLSTVDALIAALRDADETEAVRAIVLGSDLPGIFSAGLDLALMRDPSPDLVRTILTRLYIDLFEVQDGLGKPVVAALDGVVRGAGITLAISCDLLVASDTSSFAYSEIDVGLIPGIHFVHLPRLIGRHAAFELLFTGMPFGALNAVEMGLVNRVVPPPKLREAASGIAAELAKKPAHAMRAGRLAFRRIAAEPGERAAILSTIDTLCGLLASRGTQDMLDAFFEARASRRATTRTNDAP